MTKGKENAAGQDNRTGSSASRGQPPEPEQSQQDRGPEAVPTDFRRNIWLLVLIIIAVAAAWLVKHVVSGIREREGESQQPADKKRGQPTERPSPKRPSYEEMLEAQRRLARLSVYTVIGGKRRFIMASPARPPAGTDKGRSRRLFDVTRVAEGFDLADLMRFRKVYADKMPLLGQSPDAKPQFAPAREIDFLLPEERVIVVAKGDVVRAYPLRVMQVHAGIRDELGGTPVVVCWTSLTQFARCLVLPQPKGDPTWGNSGRLYRGNLVLYDRATVSLWDTFSGMALTGSEAGAKLKRLPATVHPWGQWRTDHPDAPVLTLQTGHKDYLKQRAYDPKSIDAVAKYLAAELRFAVPGYSPETSGDLPAKAFVIGVEAGGKTKAYPLATLLEAGSKTLEDQVGGVKVVVKMTSLRTGYATDAEGQVLDAPVMLWFGWNSSHPKTEVWSPPRQKDS